MKQNIENQSNEILWNELYHGFQNDICLNCRWYTYEINHRKMSNPQPIPYIGPKFGEDKYRLMFIGIETYSNERFKKIEKIEYDEFPTERVKELYLWTEPGKKYSDDYSSFWSWVREISTQVLQKDLDETFKHIAYSNLLKCQSRKKVDFFDEPEREHFTALSNNCIQKNNWIYKEIQKINPKNVIIFSGNDEEHHHAKLFLNDPEGTIIEKSKDKRWNKDLLVYINDGKRNNFITRHPRRTKNEIRDRIIKIIQNKIKEKPLDWKLC